MKMKGDAVVEWSCSCSPPPPPPPTNNNKIKIKGGFVAGINDLPDNVLVEIFIRLRAKYAHRCKSVCKHWNDLISVSSSSYFVSQYMRHNKHLGPLIFSYSMGVFKTLDNNISKTRQFSLSSFLPCFGPNNNNNNDDGKEPRVVGSSGGLLLCSTSWHIQIDYYVCNPVTMNWVELPPPRLPHQQVHVGFICEPYSNRNNNNNNNSGSEEDELNNRFIVVRIPAVEGILNTFRMEIFSSETGEWSETDVLCPPNGFRLGCQIKSATVYNGILHFLGPPSSIFAYDPYNNGDNDSLFRFIDLPEDASYYSENLRLGTSQGRLLLFWRIISPPNGGEAAPIKVWELKDYSTGNWCLAHQVSLSKLFSDSRIALDRLNLGLWLPRVLAFDSNDSDVLYILFGPSTILVGNLRHMTMKLMSGTPDMGDDRSVMCFPIDLPWPTPIPALL